MPIWLRKFTFKKIKDWYDQEREARNKKSSTSNNTQIDLANPDRSKIPDTPRKKITAPNYNMKASQK